MREDLLNYIEGLKENLDSEADKYIRMMRECYDATDEDIRKIFELTRNLCDIIEVKLNNQKEET